MALLARRANKGGLWAQASDPNRWRDTDFPHELLSELSLRSGEQGLSFFEVQGRTDKRLKRIAAALVLKGKDYRSVEFRFVKVPDAAALGVSILTTPGNTEDAQMNSLHRSVTGLTGPDAVQLAKRMALGDPRVFSAEEVMDSLVISINRKFVNPGEDFPKDFLKRLWDKGRIRLVSKLR